MLYTYSMRGLGARVEINSRLRIRELMVETFAELFEQSQIEHKMRPGDRYRR